MSQEENIGLDEVCVYYIGNYGKTDSYYLEISDLNEVINMTDFKYYFVMYHQEDGQQWATDITFTEYQRYVHLFYREQNTQLFLVYEPLKTGKMKSNISLH